MNTERVEAAAKGMFEHDRDRGLAGWSNWDRVPVLGKRDYLDLARATLSAADAASGERVVFTCNMNPVALEGWIIDEFSNRCGDIDVELKPGEELVVRKARS